MAEPLAASRFEPRREAGADWAARLRQLQGRQPSASASRAALSCSRSRRLR
jgi:hypothetical protein